MPGVISKRERLITGFAAAIILALCAWLQWGRTFVWIDSASLNIVDGLWEISVGPADPGLLDPKPRGRLTFAEYFEDSHAFTQFAVQGLYQWNTPPAGGRAFVAKAVVLQIPILTTFVLIVAYRAYTRRRRRRNIQSGNCINCGYNAAHARICPECGHAGATTLPL